MSLKTINDLTAVDESQLQNDALIEGAIPPVSGSIFAPVKVTLAKLAKWILNSYAGLSLAGSTQSAKSAFDSLSGTVTTLNGMVARETIADQVTLSDTTYIDPTNCTIRFYKVGNIRILCLTLCIIQSPTTFTNIGTIANGHRPPTVLAAPFVQLSMTTPDTRAAQILSDGRIRLTRNFAVTPTEATYYTGFWVYAV